MHRLLSVKPRSPQAGASSFSGGLLDSARELVTIAVTIWPPSWWVATVAKAGACWPPAYGKKSATGS